MPTKNRQKPSHLVLTLMIGLLLFSAPSAQSADGIDGSIANVNQLMATAKASVDGGDMAAAKINLAYTARNLEQSSTWAHYIWAERQTHPGYTPIALDPLPAELTVGFYADKIAGIRVKYKEMIVKLKEAREARARQQLKVWLQLHFNMISLGKEIKDSITGNPLLLPKNLYDMQENAEKNAGFILKNFDKLNQAGTLVKHLEDLMVETEAIYHAYRRVQADVETLLPEVKRIETAMAVARESIARGMAMPLPPDQQDRFGGEPFNNNLTAVKTDLDAADLPWESGLPIMEDVKKKADAVYVAIPSKTADDTAAYNAFVSSYNTFKTNLQTARENRIEELTVLGNAWRETLISILNRYLAISLGSPVALADCSGRNSVDASLALDDMERRAWKSEYATLLAAPTGPSIVPAQDGSGADAWHEYTARYPARLMERLNAYDKAWQSAYASMSYADWQALSTTTDTRQPYQVFVLKRGSLNVLLENLNVLRGEANRYDGAFGNALDAVKALESDLATLQSRADAYRRFLADNAGKVPAPEFDEYVKVTDADVPGLSARLSFAGEGVSVLETETLIAHLRRVMTEFEPDADGMREQATKIGNKADVIAFEINRMLLFNDALATKRSAAREMLDYKFDSDKDVFLGPGDYGYLFDSLEILDNALWQHVDTWYSHANPPNVQAQIVPHVTYIQSLEPSVWSRFAWLTEQVWSVTDNLAFAQTEVRPNPSTWGTGYGSLVGNVSGASHDTGKMLILAENKELVDEFTRVRFLKYHNRPYTDPIGYLTLDEIRQGLPRTRAWVDTQTGGGYTGLILQRVTPESYALPVNRKSQGPFTVRIVDGTGKPVAGVPVSLDYNTDTLRSTSVATSDTRGLANFYPGPYSEAGERTISFAVVHNAGGETGPSIITSLNTSVTVTADTDGDGCPDAWETLHGFDPLQAFDGAGDFDGDGLTNAQETALGTDPLTADTDGDGYSDGVEATAGSDPLDVTDTPRPAAPETPPMLLGKHWQKMADDIGGTRLQANDYAFSRPFEFKGQIWAFGHYTYRDGDNVGHYVNELWRSPDGIRWSRTAANPPWAPRRGYGVTVHNNRIYVVGGYLEDWMNAPYPQTYFGDVWFSDDGETWSRATDRTAFGLRYGTRLHSLGDRLLLMGGFLVDPINQRYGDQQDIWSSPDGITWTRILDTPPWPQRRMDSLASVVFDNQLWVMGGDWSEYDAEKKATVYQTFRDIWRSSDGKAWIRVTDAPAWRARYGADLVACNGRLWLFGGYDHTDSYLDPTLALPFEVWSSANGAEWLRVEAPTQIKGLAFATDRGLWSLVQPQDDAGITRHTLWHSRGTTQGDSTGSFPVTANPTTFSAGADHALAVKGDGTLWAWGGNDSGQLGNGTTERSPRPLRIGTDNTWKAVAAGWFFSLGIKTDGTLWAWGQNDYGQLGDSTNTNHTEPVQVGQDTNWASLAAGQSHTLAVKTDGTLWAWGLNNGGQLGDGTKANKNNPIQIDTEADWIQVAAGSTHSAAVRRDGSIWMWGSNSYGQLGIGVGESLTPKREEGSIAAWAPLKSGVSTVSAGSAFTTALRSDGTLYAWGNNAYGQIGMGYWKGNAYITPINPFDAWVAASAGYNFTAAIRGDNRLWGWGNTDTGAPGDGTFIAANTPQPIGEDRDWVAVESGATFFLARKADGSLWAWGDPGNGQLGNGTFWRSQAPTRVLPLGATDADTDGDGMDDEGEKASFGDLTRDGTGDFDRDGLTDFQEFHLGTNPARADTEGDGMPDHWEFQMGLNPLMDDARGDHDGDGVSNLDEDRIVRFRSIKDGGWSARAFDVSGQKLYVIQDALDGDGLYLKVFDTAAQEAPVLLGTYEGHFGRVFGIRVRNGIATVADGNGNFQFIHVSNPAEMKKLGQYLMGGYIQGFDASATLVCAADTNGYLQIVDMTDTSAPSLLGTYTNNDQGGLGKVFVSGNRLYATLGGNAIQIIDIGTPHAPVKIGQYDAGDLVWPPAVALSGTAMAAAVRPWEEGPSVKFIQADDPQSLTVVGRYGGYASGIAWAGNLAAVATETAIDVVDVRNPAKPRRIADINNLFFDHRSAMVLSGGLLFVPYNLGEAGSGIAIVDVSRFLRPLLQGGPGDANHSETVDLTDAVLALQGLVGRTPSEPVYTDADLDGDGRIGLAEVLFILQRVAGLRR